MLRSIVKNRSYRIAAIIFAIAFGVCWLAWMRFFTVAALNPSPVRYFTFITDQGTMDPFRQECTGPAFAQDDVAWRFCEYNASTRRTTLESGQWGLVRFDLTKGEAALHWPLPETATAQILALAQSPAGDLATAWGSPELSAVYLILHEGGVVPLGIPQDASPEVFGLAWDGQVLELVVQDGSTITIFRNESGVWSEPHRIPPPEACGAATVCVPQVAHRDAAGWRFLYAATPVEIGDPQTAVIQVLLGDESGSASALGTIPFSDLDPSQYVLDDSGRLARLGALFDRSPGGSINWSLDAAPYTLQDDTWQRVATPISGASFYFSNYQIEPDGLRWIPGLRYPWRSWQVDQWVMVTASDNGMALSSLSGTPGPVLTHNTSFLLSGGALTVVFPCSTGGYWVLGPHGAYLKVSVSLERADGLSFPERIVRAFENFGRLGAVNQDFYRGWRALKLATFPLVLLSLPFGYLLVFFARQSRKNTRAWITLLMQISALYLILAAIFIWWFWEMTGDF
jgi:hypothetical protein